MKRIRVDEITYGEKGRKYGYFEIRFIDGWKKYKTDLETFNYVLNHDETNKYCLIKHLLETTNKIREEKI